MGTPMGVRLYRSYSYPRPHLPFGREDTMRRVYSSVLTLALVSVATTAQAQSEESRAVAGGGITVPGWAGQIDAAEAGRGMTISNAKFEKQGDALHAVTGPAVTYWSPANKATGNYTVKATFREPHYMSLNDHPHPYGIVIAGNDLGTDQQSYLY